MKLTITEKGSKEFYKEVLSVTAQYKKFLKKPEMKLVDQFKTLKMEAVASILLFAYYLFEILDSETTILTIVLDVLLIIIGIISVIMLFDYNRRLKTMLQEDGEAELTIDEQGVELIKNSLTVKTTWENIAFARIFKESICFIPNNQTGLIIAVSNKYLEEIKPYIKTQIYQGK